MRAIAIANQKGGCGKTTTAINLSAALAFLQKKTLLIDLDPQGHATCGLGIQAEFLERTSYNLFDPTSSVNDLIVPINEHLSLIPTYVILSQIEQEQGTRTYSRECVAKRLLEVTEPYDYVVIDSPPHIGLLTANAFFAAGEVIIPIEPSFFSLHGLAKIFETIDLVQKLRNKKIRLHALMTRFEKRMRLAREIQEEVKKYFHDQTFLTAIDENVRLKEAAAVGKSIVDFDRNSVGFRNYINLAIELIERGLIWQAEEELEVSAPSAPKKTVPVIPIVPLAEPLPAAFHPQLETESAALSSPLELHCTLEHQVADIDPKELKPRKVLSGILFSFLNPKAAAVLVAGDFNRWVAEPLLLIDAEVGLWQKIVSMEPGTHHYKFLVDDVWQTDPFNQVTQPNPYGGFDSILTVDSSPPGYENGKEAKTGTG